jgi:RNA-directed DNA polymerase
MKQAKPYSIPKQLVWDAYLRVKAAKGAGGVDGVYLEDFEKNLKKNLFKIWNRMSSGCYFPLPVKEVVIPKRDGGKRSLGIPTVSDRVAQMVVKMILEPILEPKFHADSYGYRPGKSAHDALKQCKWRCWWKDWVVDVDIKGFFDNIDHELMMRMVKHHTNVPWIILYIERWLKADVQKEDGTMEKREKGTPQGGVISPLLANLYLHHAFDEWMKKDFDKVRFERFADDIVIHVLSQTSAERIVAKLKERLALFKLSLHPEKTKIVYCRDSQRMSTRWPIDQFDFLGFTFKRRTATGKEGNIFDGFLPAISKAARKDISTKIREWRINRRTMIGVKELSKLFNPAIRGWYNYFAKHYPSEMKPIETQIDLYLVRWAKSRYKKYQRQRWAFDWLNNQRKNNSGLFAHWAPYGHYKVR